MMIEPEKKSGLANQTAVGLALGSGAARGLSYIGVIDALENAGIRIQMLAGTSIGALIGALYASGIPVNQMEQVACSLNWRRLASLIDPIIPTSGLIDGKKVTRFIDELLPVKSFEELEIPLAVTATDIETGELIVIRKGSLLAAIEAAIAFPGIFAPVQIGDQFLVDGGICAPVPTDVVRNMGAEYIIGVCAIPEVEKQYSEAISPASTQKSDKKGFLEHFNSEWIENTFREVWQGKNNKSDNRPQPIRKPPGLFRVFAQSVAIMENQINALRIDKDQIDLLIRPELREFRLLEFHRARQIIDRGKEAATAALLQIK
ncbi:MAG: patatin [Desulfuromonas sp.]|nr:MAG: patatin [Desulfuromonas sp.]